MSKKRSWLNYDDPSTGGTVPFALLERSVMRSCGRPQGFNFNSLNVYLAVCSYSWVTKGARSKFREKRNPCCASLREIGRLARIRDERTVRRHLLSLEEAKCLAYTSGTISKYGTRNIHVGYHTPQPKYFSVPKQILEDVEVTGPELAAYVALRAECDSSKLNDSVNVSISALARSAGMARNTMKKALSLLGESEGGLVLNGWGDVRRLGAGRKSRYSVDVYGVRQADPVDMRGEEILESVFELQAIYCDFSPLGLRRALAMICAVGHAQEMVIDVFFRKWHPVGESRTSLASILASPLNQAALRAIRLKDTSLEYLPRMLRLDGLRAEDSLLDLMRACAQDERLPDPRYVELLDGLPATYREGDLDPEWILVSERTNRECEALAEVQLQRFYAAGQSDSEAPVRSIVPPRDPQIFIEGQGCRDEPCREGGLLGAGETRLDTYGSEAHR